MLTGIKKFFFEIIFLRRCSSVPVMRFNFFRLRA